MQFIAKLKTKSFQILQRNSSHLFVVSGVMSSNPSARLEKLRWPEMIVKLRKGKKIQTLQIFFKAADIKILKKLITSRSYASTYNQTLGEIMWLLRLKKPKNDKNFKKLASCIKKLKKFVIIKIEKLIHGQNTLSSNLLSNYNGDFLLG